jgi:hypothetical protein
MADGFVFPADGLVCSSHGVVSSLDGLVCSADGLVSLPDGPVSSSDGIVSSPDDLVRITDGSVSSVILISKNALANVSHGSMLHLHGSDEIYKTFIMKK